MYHSCDVGSISVEKTDRKERDGWVRSSVATAPYEVESGTMRFLRDASEWSDFYSDTIGRTIYRPQLFLLRNHLDISK